MRCWSKSSNSAKKHVNPSVAAFASMQNLIQEQFGPIVLRVVEEVIWRGLLDYFTLVHKDHPIGHSPGKAHFMGHAEHGHAVFSQADHGVEYFLDHFRVER